MALSEDGSRSFLLVADQPSYHDAPASKPSSSHRSSRWYRNIPLLAVFVLTIGFCSQRLPPALKAFLPVGLHSLPRHPARLFGPARHEHLRRAFANPPEQSWADLERGGPLGPPPPAKDEEAEEFWRARRAQVEREGRTALLSRAKAHPPEADTETWLEDAAWNQVGAEAEDSEDWTIMRGNYRRRFAVRVPRDSALPTDMRPADPQHGEPDVDVAQWGPGYGDNGPWGAAAPAQQWGGAYEEEWGGEGQGGGAGEGALQPYTAAVYPRYDWNNPEPWSQRADAVSAAVREITTLNLPPLYIAMLLQELTNNQAWRADWVPSQEWPVLHAAYIQLSDAILPSVQTQNSTELSAIAMALAELAEKATRLPKFLAQHEGQPLMTAIARRAEDPAVLETMTAQEATQLLTVFGALGIPDPELVAAMERRLLTDGVLPQLTAADVAAIFWGLAKVGVPMQPALRGALTHHLRARGLGPVLAPADVANLLWSMATANAKDDLLLLSVGDRICQTGFLQTCDARSVADMVWALGMLDVRNVTVLTALADRVVHPGFLRFFDTTATANVAWAFAALNRGTKTLYDRLASRLMADNFLYLLTPIETSNVVWAYGKLGFQNEVMLLALANRIMQPYFLDACDPPVVANFAWSFAKLGLFSDVLMRGLRSRIVSPGFLAALDPQSLTNILWAYATFRFHDPDLFLTLAEKILADDMLEELTTPQLVNVVWAYARLGIPKEKGQVEALLRRLQDCLLAPHALKDLSTPQVANVAWGYVALGIHNKTLLAALADHVKSQPRSMRQCDNGNVDALCWAYATVGLRDVDLLQLVARHVREEPPVLAATHPRSIGNITRAFALFGVKDAAMMEAIAARILAPNSNLVSRFDPESLATTLWAFGRLEVRHEGLLARLAELILTEPFLAKCQPSHLVRFAWAFAALRVPHPDLAGRLQARLLQPSALNQLDAPLTVDLLWASHRLGAFPEELQAAAAQRVLAMAPADAAAVAKTLAERGVKSPPLLTRLAMRIVQDGIILSFGAEGLAKVLWAFNKLGSRHSGLFVSVATQLGEVDSDALVAVLRAFVREGVTDEPLWQVLRGRMAQLKGPELGAVAQVVVEEGFADAALLAALADRVAAPAVLRTLDAEAVVPLAVAYGGAVLGPRHGAVMGRLAAAVSRFAAAEVAAVAEGLAQLEVDDAEIVGSVQQRVAQFSAAEVAEAAVAFAELQVVSPQFLEPLVSRAMEHRVLEALTVEQTVALVAALSRLPGPREQRQPLEQRLRRLPAGEVAGLAVAVAERGVQDAGLEAALRSRAMYFDPEELATCAKELGAKFVWDSPLGVALLDRVAAFGPAEVADAAVAMERRGVAAKRLTAALARRLADFDVAGLADVAAGLQAGKAEPEYLLAGFTRRILQLDASSLVALFQGLVHHDVHSPQLEQSIADRLMHLEPAGMATAAVALTGLGSRAVPLLTPVTKRVAELRPADLAALAAALGPGPAASPALAAALLRRLRQLSAAQVVEVAEELAARGLAEGDFAEALASRATQPGMGDALPPDDLARLAAACGRPVVGDLLARRVAKAAAADVAGLAAALEKRGMVNERLRDGIARRAATFRPAEVASAAGVSGADLLIPSLEARVQQMSVPELIGTAHEMEAQDVHAPALHAALIARLAALDAPGVVLAAKAIRETGLGDAGVLAAVQERLRRFEGPAAVEVVLQLAKANVASEAITSVVAELLARADPWQDLPVTRLLPLLAAAKRWDVLAGAVVPRVAEHIAALDPLDLVAAAEGLAVLRLRPPALLAAVARATAHGDLALAPRDVARLAVAVRALGLPAPAPAPPGPGGAAP